MLRRNALLIGFLVLGSTALFTQDSWAGVTLSGLSFKWNSIDCASILKGLAKKDAPSTTVGCSAQIIEANLKCVNKGGNADSNAEKFQPEATTVSVSVTANS